MNEYPNKREFIYQIGQYEQVLNINSDDYNNLYYVISESENYHKALALSCYDDGLKPKVLFLKGNKVVIGCNKSFSHINWDTLDELKKETVPFTILAMQLLKERILVLHEFGVSLYSSELKELSAHNRNIPLEDFCVENDKIKVKFENESEYFLDCVE